MIQESSWRVVHVSSNEEKRVAQHLQARSVEYYLPLYSEKRRWADRIVISERPLFTGYVFTRFLSRERIGVISVPGVLRVLGEDGQNLVSHAEIEKIRSGLASGLLLRPHAGITVGTKVLVLRGFRAQGIVRELRHHQCCVIMSLGNTYQCFSLEVEISNLEILKEQQMQLQPPNKGVSCFLEHR